MTTTVKEKSLDDYPARKIAPYQVLKKRYLKTRDFYDLPESVELDSILYRYAFDPERRVFFKRDARLIIYPSDLAAIYGRSARWGRQYLQDLREDKGLPRGAAVTIKDFCNWTGHDYETIHAFIMES